MGFGKTIDDNCALAHARQLCEADMLLAAICQLAINFIRNDNNIGVAQNRCDFLQILPLQIKESHREVDVFADTVNVLVVSLYRLITDAASSRRGHEPGKCFLQFCGNLNLLDALFCHK